MDKYIDAYIEKVGCNPIENLTQLYTPGFFFFYIDTLITGYKNSYKDLNFVVTALDLDSFNLLNQTEGYLAGDQILKSVSKMIKETIRSKDLATRVSGNTFLIFFSNLQQGEETTAVNRIRLKFANELKTNITIGTGFASFPKDGKTIDELKQSALSNLNYSKFSRYQDSTEPGSWIAVEDTNVLIVDDDQKNCKLLKAMIAPLKYNIYIANSGKDALLLVKKFDFDIILLDVMMPGLNGFEVCKILKNTEETWKIPVIMVTALDDVESKIKGIEAGADDFITKPPVREEITARIKSLVRLHQVNRNYTSIENVLLSLANAVEAKDSYTQGHTERVSLLAEKIGREMHLPEKDIIALRLCGILHDVGKIGIPSDLLNKPGPLNPEEWEKMKTHPGIGYTICLPLSTTLGGALDIIRHHHEKLDGSSYPDGLSGDSISLNSRIVSIVDIFDALTSDRPYRKSMSNESAINILLDGANHNLLDKQIVDILIKLTEHGNTKMKRKDDALSDEDKRVLIVEDDPLNYKLMKTLLQFNKYVVKWIKNADDIFKDIISFQPDLILMDIQLPGKDGFTATRQIKSNKEYSFIPIIAVSAHAMDINKQDALEAGCVEYITKPLDTRTFANSIGRYL